MKGDCLDSSKRGWVGYAFLGGIVALFGAIYLKNVWVAEDAYIVFRSLEQLFSGNGPIWNPHERVQVFTSPLWYWLLAIPRTISTDHFLNVVLLSTLLVGLMFFFVQRTLQSHYRLLVAVLLLVCCNGFMDYTSSGLENPLAYALLAYFLYLYLRLFGDDVENPYRSLSLLSLTFGLLIVTRHDLVLLVLPAVGYLLVRYWGALSYRQWLVLGLQSSVLLVGWSLFSLLYYGSIFPNTAYAKLNTGIPSGELFQQGMLYFNASLLRDTIYVPVMLLALLLTLFSRAVYLRFIGLGLVANMFYILYVGGDFMLGRFFSYSYLMAVIVLCAVHSSQLPEWLNKKVVPTGVAVALPLTIFLYAVFYFHTPFNSPFDYSAEGWEDGVADERGYYFKTNSLSAYWDYVSQPEASRTAYFPVHGWSQGGWEARPYASRVVPAGAIGMVGYWSGTHHKIVDQLALSDPLLARLPIRSDQPWRIGHFTRNIPYGYIETLVRGEILIRDPKLAEFYSKIVLITQSPELFSRERLMTIVAMNRGEYDYLIEHLR